MVIYHDFSTLSTFYDQMYNLDNCGRISYWLTYKYLQDTSIEYLFGIEYDFEGNRVSDDKFPDISKNKKFMKIIELCKAIDIVKNQNNVQIDSIKSIELNYDNDINSYVWLITEDYPSTTTGFHEYDLIFINANSGELYKHEKMAAMIIE